MSGFKKISYYDLREDAATKLPLLVGRIEELERLNRIASRRLNNNVLLVGPAGIGKSALAHGWMRRRARRNPEALLRLDSEHIASLDEQATLEESYAEALSHIPAGVLFVDDFGRAVYKNAALMQRVARLYRSLLRSSNTRLMLTAQPQEYAWLKREFPAFVNAFETIQLKQQNATECTRILSKALPRLNKKHRVIVPDDMLKEIIAHAERFPALGQLPRSGIALLDETVAFAASRKEKMLTSETVLSVVAAKTGVPKARLSRDELESVKELERSLNERILGQQSAIANIAATLKRAKLGLRGPNRPLGSFLLLGPSGVGKTETAKSVAELMYASAGAFLRFDMSEFQQEHTVQRLIGAPAGYVGHEEGGSLTNALKKDPYSLVLLDEIEKAHPKVFDIFLQLLDDGRLTSGQNETVDARNAIFMATSNAAVNEILQGYVEGVDEETFIKEKVLPVLTKTFRPEFINRFDRIVLFKPLGTYALVDIAHLEMKKIERRLAKHRVRFELEPAAFEARVRSLADPRFGARPIKRFVEETCETLLMRSLLGTPHAAAKPL